MTAAGYAPLVSSLRRLLQTPAVPRSRNACELCGVTLAEPHAHAVDIRTRRLLCTCGVCAGAGRFRRVPTRYVHMPSMTMTAAQWEALAIPVDLAFFFFNSELGRTIAFYPGPAGVAESQLPLQAWSAVAASNPWVGTVEPDVEAVLVRKAGDQYVCGIVPIAACYELAGRIRSSWSGWGGGEAVRGEIERFFADIRARSAR
jgi:hypothetical protein